MGSCCSQSDDVTQTDGLDERKRLMENPVCDATSYGTASKSTMSNAKPELEDEKLGRIVRQVEVDVIDVPALRSLDESRDFTDKVEKYSQKLNAAKPTVCTKKKECLLEDVPTPEEVLSKSPVSVKEKEMMDKCFEKTQSALKDIKVDHKEDLVVPFILT